MFDKLIASAPEGRKLLRNPAVIIVSIGAHALVLAGIVYASTRPEVEAPPEPEQITYIDITEIPPPEPDPEEIYEAPPEPTEAPPAETPPAPTPPRATPRAAPPPRARAPATPRNPQPSPTAADRPAGFQELQTPDVDVAGIPAPDLSAPPVRAEDFGGRGAVGGTAAGAPAPAPAPAPRSGSSGGSGGAGGGAADAGSTFSANLVDEQVQLANSSEMARLLSRRYPRALREANIEGRVVVQFVVDQNGRVEAGSVKLISASNPELVEPSLAAVDELRFRPAKKQGRSVRQIVQFPFTWQIER